MPLNEAETLEEELTKKDVQEVPTDEILNVQISRLSQHKKQANTNTNSSINHLDETQQTIIPNNRYANSYYLDS